MHFFCFLASPYQIPMPSPSHALPIADIHLLILQTFACNTFRARAPMELAAGGTERTSNASDRQCSLADVWNYLLLSRTGVLDVTHVGP